MKLGDIKLTDEQAAAFVRWLDNLIAEQWAEGTQEAARSEQEDRLYVRYKKLCKVAEDTARLHGPLLGVRPHDQADAAWAAFIDNEGYFSTFDVDERFDPAADASFAEGWTNTYTRVIEEMRREQRSARRVQSA